MTYGIKYARETNAPENTRRRNFPLVNIQNFSQFNLHFVTCKIDIDYKTANFDIYGNMKGILNNKSEYKREGPISFCREICTS